MDSGAPLAKHRAASYADALRGHKVLAPKPKPAGDQKAELAPIPKEVPKAARAATKKLNHKQGLKAAQGKRQQVDPKIADEKVAGTPRPAQSGKASQSGTLKPPQVRGATEQPPQSVFSYAEAVKGKSLSTTRGSMNVETSLATQIPPSPSIEVTTPKLAPKPPSQPVSLHGVNARDTTGPEHHGFGRQDSTRPEDELVRHLAGRMPLGGPAPASPDHRTGQYAPAALQPSFSGSFVAYMVRRRSSATWQNRNPESRSDCGPERASNRAARRFSAGDVTASSSQTLSVSLPRLVPLSPSIASATTSQPTATSSDAPTTPRLCDSHIETAIQQAIMAENKRLKMTEERENRTRALIAAHDQGTISYVALRPPPKTRLANCPPDFGNRNMNGTSWSHAAITFGDSIATFSAASRSCSGRGCHPRTP